MKIGFRYGNLPLKHKLRLIIMSVVTAALVFDSAAVLAYDQIESRSKMRSDLRVLAEIFAGQTAHHIRCHLRQHGQAIRDLPAFGSAGWFDAFGDASGSQLV